MKAGWKRFTSVLCIRLDNMGDVLMTQPALRALKQHVRGRRITLLTSPAASGISALLPEVDEVLTARVPWGKQGQDSRHGLSFLALQLRQKKFQAAVIFTNFSQCALPAATLCSLAGIPRVLAYSRTNPFSLVSDWVPDMEPYERISHGVERQLSLVRHVGARTGRSEMALLPDSRAKNSALEKLASLGLYVEMPWVCAVPGASDQKRRYSIRLLAKGLQLFAKKFGVQVVVLGTKAEAGLGKQVMRHAPGIAACGLLTFPELVSVISLSKLLISNNTGPVHIAAAVGTPVVDLYARTNPEHTPWGIPYRVLYFNVPPRLKSRSPVLGQLLPQAGRQNPNPGDIAAAAEELWRGVPLSRSKIARRLMTW